MKEMPVPEKLKGLSSHEPLKGLVSAFKKRFPEGELYLVGGTVRDALLGRTDSKDYDLVARLVDAAELESFLNTQGRVDLVGKRFGVWKFVPRASSDELRVTSESPARSSKLETRSSSAAIDIALPRTEHSFNQGGYRDVSVDSDPNLPIEKDLERRDFTVNAMALRLAPTPGFSDPFGGKNDLRDKTIKTVGKPEERFREDYSRMLRALRFACQLNFKIEEHTALGIRMHMEHVNDFRSTPEGNMRVVSTEIIAREFVKGLVAHPVMCFDLWYTSGATEILMPELLTMRGCTQPPNHHSEGDVWAHTRLALSKVGDDDFKKRFGADKVPPIVYLGVLFHDIAKPATKQTPEEHGTDRIRFTGHDVVGAEMTETISRRLTFSSVEGYSIDTERLAWLVRHHLFTLQGKVEEVRPTTLEKYFFNPNVPGKELLMVIYCDSMGTVPETGISDRHLEHLDVLMRRIDELAKMGAGRKLPPPLLDGIAIMRMKNLKPGPRVGEIMNELREAQLAGDVKTENEAEEFIKKL